MVKTQIEMRMVIYEPGGSGRVEKSWSNTKLGAVLRRMDNFPEASLEARVVVTGWDNELATKTTIKSDWEGVSLDRLDHVD